MLRLRQLLLMTISALFFSRLMAASQETSTSGTLMGAPAFSDNTAKTAIEATGLPIEEQDRLDTMVRTLQRLPAPEIDRLGVDLSSPVLKGSEQAELLKKAWAERQIELKQAMASILKPAEVMASLSKKLRDPSSHHNEVTESLKELEDLLTDIDNARDFHTIGGWPILVGFLKEDKPVEHQTYAAWAVGTAVKNSYDYQLWVLETYEEQMSGDADSTRTASTESSGASAPFEDPKQNSCLRLLVNLLERSLVASSGPRITEEQLEKLQELQRRLIYAVSSAARGNTDIQQALLMINQERMAASLHSSAISSELASRTNEVAAAQPALILYLSEVASAVNATSLGLSRKVWALISDMLEERAYVRDELMKSSDLPAEARAQLLDMRLLGDEFCNVQWATIASVALSQLVHDYTSSMGSLDVNQLRFGETSNVTSSMAPGYVASLRATIDSILVVLSQIFSQSPQAWDGPQSVGGELRAILRADLMHVAALQEDVNESLVERAKNILQQLPS